MNRGMFTLLFLVHTGKVRGFKAWGQELITLFSDRLRCMPDERTPCSPAADVVPRRHHPEGLVPTVKVLYHRPDPVVGLLVEEPRGLPLPCLTLTDSTTGMSLFPVLSFPRDIKAHWSHSRCPDNLTGARAKIQGST